MTLAIKIENLEFSWPKQKAVMLSVPSFELASGEHLFLRGPSGSGKTSFLSLVTGMIVAQRGRIELFGQDVRQLSARKRDQLRADRIGYIFQMFNLLPYLSVMENVILPIRFSAYRRQKLRDQGRAPDVEARRLLERLSLSESGIEAAATSELSIGQQQRVAVARALIGSPDLIVADEPTSALDNDAKLAFLKLLQEECLQHETALIFVSHDAALATQFSRQVDIQQLKPS